MLVARALSQNVFLLSLLAVVSVSRPAAAEDLSGCWRGCWESCCTGHHGPLKATFCKLDDTHYRVDFRGRFWVVVPFRYSVVLTVTGREGDKVLLAGDSYLGRLLGTFHYEAEATDCEFKATYTSCRDRGEFALTRCCR
ncbi:MAG TPA: hypothetical protein VKI65_12195 [Gemmataceae bacterium]|nr:hypothetical protein [Gemmataceae bacterium]